MLLKMVGKDTEKLMIIFITIPLSTLKCKLTFKKLASVHMGREKKENAIRICCAALVLCTNTSSAKQLQQIRWRMLGYCSLILVKNIKSSSQIAASLKTNRSCCWFSSHCWNRIETEAASEPSSLLPFQFPNWIFAWGVSLNFPQTGNFVLNKLKKRRRKKMEQGLKGKNSSLLLHWQPRQRGLKHLQSISSC